MEYDGTGWVSLAQSAPQFGIGGLYDPASSVLVADQIFSTYFVRYQLHMHHDGAYARVALVLTRAPSRLACAERMTPGTFIIE